jgi:hypothetical protein
VVIVATTVAVTAGVAAAGDVAADVAVADARRAVRVDAISPLRNMPLHRVAIRSAPVILAEATAATTTATSAVVEDLNVVASTVAVNPAGAIAPTTIAAPKARVTAALRNRVAGPKSLSSSPANRWPSIAASPSPLLQRRSPSPRSTSVSPK